MLLVNKKLVLSVYNKGPYSSLISPTGQVHVTPSRSQLIYKTRRKTDSFSLEHYLQLALGAPCLFHIHEAPWGVKVLLTLLRGSKS